MGTEDSVLRHLTTESPISVDCGKGVPTFNPSQLEDCDLVDSDATISWWGEGRTMEAGASLQGQQFLFSVPSESSPVTRPVVRNDVDGLAWSLEADKAIRALTFPALGYVVASKSSRKFIISPPSGCYWCVADRGRHVYVYRQPAALAEEMGLRNRGSGQSVDKIAKQQVLTLEDSREILGVAANERNLFVVTESKLYVVTVN